MKFEHIGLFVSQPFDMADWYVENLGFVIRKSSGDLSGGGVFLADGTDRTLIELCSNSNTAPLDLPNMPESQLHIALVSEDPIADSERLQSVGAKFVEQIGPSEDGELLILLRDPWGANIQLAKRAPGKQL